MRFTHKENPEVPSAFVIIPASRQVGAA